ncbi:MAG: cupin domain-containing protein [Pseudomonadota bacterium]
MIKRSDILGAVLLMALPSLAVAGSCPKDSVLTEPRDLDKVSGQAVSVETWETVELEDWRDVGPLRMRLRHFTIEPGGRVPVHSHGDRPSILYFVSGEATEHNAYCAEPIVHKPGESAAEFGPGIVHWWSNEGDVPVVLISVDIVPSN